MSNLINYSGAPNHAFSGETTDFEDALIKHDVITKSQALHNKGMSTKDVSAVLKRDQAQKDEKIGVDIDTVDYYKDNNKDNIKSYTDSEDELLDDDDEDFLNKYREQRIGEMKAKASLSPPGPGGPEPGPKGGGEFTGCDEISRADWQREVNDAR